MRMVPGSNPGLGQPTTSKLDSSYFTLHTSQVVIDIAYSTGFKIQCHSSYFKVTALHFTA